MTALLLAAAGLSAACGDDAQPDAAKEQAPSSSPSIAKDPGPAQEELIVGIIDKFHKAVDKGDGKTACTLLTADLKGVYAQNPGASDCPSGIEQLHDSLNGAKLSSMKFAAEDVDITRKNKEAVVSHELIATRNGTDPDQTDSYNFEMKNGKWKISYIG